MSSFAIEHARRRLASSLGGAVTVDRAVLEKLVEMAESSTNQEAVREFEQQRGKAVARAKKVQEANG